MKLDWASKKKISCVVQYLFSLHSLSLSLSLSRWIQLLLPMYDELCIFGMDKSTSSPRSGPSYTYPDSLTDHNAICYSSWDHISFSSFFLIYPVYHIYIYIYMKRKNYAWWSYLDGGGIDRCGMYKSNSHVASSPLLCGLKGTLNGKYLWHTISPGL